MTDLRYRLVWCITDAVFTVFGKFHLPCVKSVIRRYRDKALFDYFRGQSQLNLGQSSCFFDLWSNFQFDLSRSKSICFDASWREKHVGF